MQVPVSDFQRLTQILKHPRLAFGSTFLHLAVESSSTETRRLALTSLSQLAGQATELIGSVVSESLSSYLSKSKAAPVNGDAADEGSTKKIKHDSRLCAYFLTCAGVGADADRSAREELLVGLVVLGHHPSLGMVLLALFSVLELT